MKYSETDIKSLFTLFSSSEKGLTSTKAEEIKEEMGLNTLPEKKKSRIKMILSQFNSPLVYILFGAVGVSIAIPLYKNGSLDAHDLIEPVAIFSILILNALFGFFQEMKAENTLQALKGMQPNVSTVIRNGEKQEILRENIVPGDVLALSEGDRIPADARLIEAHQLKTIESALTGESLPVKKDANWIGSGGIGDQKNMVFSGTSLATGRALALVVSTGIQTEIGKIALLVSEIKSPPTPLEKRLQKLGRQIGIVVVLLCALVFILSFANNISFEEALITAVALAVSAVPEGLPAVMTISLAVGVGIMAKKKAVVRELRAVETLGSVTIIASDKTGTITQNKMSVVQVFADDHHILPKEFSHFQKSKTGEQMLDVAENCNDASLPHIGDPTEIALLEMAEPSGIIKRERIDETPFSSDTKWMSTTHLIDKKKVEFLKGAPEVIAEFCQKKNQKIIITSAENMAKEGLRTIAIATRKSGEKAVFLGIFGLLDPPRKTAAKAIQIAKKAGIRTIMITGDHALTATTIARKVGLTGETITGSEIENMTEQQLLETVKTGNIFARVSPEHKVRICAALQKNGQVVAMTGDGVNDAPALHQAEVGISMGKVGTSVARQSSDLVLMDDQYATIVAGVEEGRRIFSNIKKSVSYLMRTNFGGIFLVMFSVFLGLPLPLLPIHILFINLVTDSFPALSLAMEPAEKNIMLQKPRPTKEGFLYGQWKSIIVLGGLAAILELYIFVSSLSEMTLMQAQTLVLATSIFIELTVIFSVRSDERIFSHGKVFLQNPWVLYSVLLGIGLFLISLYTPLSVIMGIDDFPRIYWGFPLFSAGLVFAISEMLKGKK